MRTVCISKCFQNGDTSDESHRVSESKETERDILFKVVINIAFNSPVINPPNEVLFNSIPEIAITQI